MYRDMKEIRFSIHLRGRRTRDRRRAPHRYFLFQAEDTINAEMIHIVAKESNAIDIPVHY